MRQIPFSDETIPLLPPGYSQPPFQEKKEVHLRDYLKVVRKRRWMIIASFIIVVIATAIETLPLRSIYRGTATIQINRESPNILDFKEIFSVNMWDQDYYQTQHKILESRGLARRVVRALKLSEHPEFHPAPQTFFQQWTSYLLNPAHILDPVFDLFTSSKKESPSPQKPSEPSAASDSPDPAESEKENALVNQFLNLLKIEPVKNSRIVKIHFDSYYPDLSAQAPNTLAKEFIQQSLEARFSTGEQAKDWLNKQLEVLKAKVESSDEALQAFGLKHDIISFEDKENVALQRLTELNNELTKAESERMTKEVLYRQTRDRSIESLPAILDHKLIGELRQNYFQLEAQYTKLSQTFKPEYPEMVRLSNQMKGVQKRIDAEMGRVVAGIKSDYELALRRETLLRQAFEQQKARVMGMKENAIQYNILKREADTNKELYRGLLQRVKETGVSAGITASNIQVVDQAERPASPYKPNKQRTLLMAAMIGLLLGVGLAFFFEYLDNTIKTPEDIEQLIRLPSFGMVPEISYKRRKKIEEGKSFPVELITHGHPKSMLSEAYRNIRTSILLSFSERPPKKIVITSPNPAEGKTTTAINTAIALSQTGAQVIIIDSDLRKPRIHKIFDQENGVGLSSFLSGNVKLESIIKKTEIPNLCYIPSGPIPPNPSELLSSNLFQRLLDALSERFDHIVLDSPPVLGFADSVIVSTIVDGTILVAAGGKTPRETLQRAKETLYQVNAKILGVVINRVDIQRSDYGYYYYRYHYYYGKEGKKKELPYTSEGDSVST